MCKPGYFGVKVAMRLSVIRFFAEAKTTPTVKCRRWLSIISPEMQ